MALQQPPISEADLQRAREEGGVEYVDGHLVEKPVSKETSRIAAQITFLLKSHVKSAGAGVEIFDSSLGYECFEEPTRWRKPDVSAMSRQRLATLEPDPGLMPIPADLAVEVLSPGDRAYDVAVKTEEYLRNGFPLLWIVHPATRTVEIHRADGTVTKLREGDEITGESGVPGFRARVAEFFQS